MRLELVEGPGAAGGRRHEIFAAKWQRGGRDPLAVLQQSCALERVPQLADIPGPRIAHDETLRFGVELPPSEELLGQGQDVFRTLAKRWQPERHDVDPVVEIPAKRTGGE